MPVVNKGVGYIRQAFSFGVSAVRLAVWAPNTVTQIAVNLVLIAALILASSVSFGAGIPLALVAVVLLLVGIARFAWQLVR